MQAARKGYPGRVQALECQPRSITVEPPSVLDPCGSGATSRSMVGASFGQFYADETGSGRALVQRSQNP
jgi:hypothetical protein